MPAFLPFLGAQRPFVDVSPGSANGDTAWLRQSSAGHRTLQNMLALDNYTTSHREFPKKTHEINYFLKYFFGSACPIYGAVTSFRTFEHNSPLQRDDDTISPDVREKNISRALFKR